MRSNLRLKILTERIFITECDQKVTGSAPNAVKVEPVVGEKFSILCLFSLSVRIGQAIAE